jgi:uncharacterized protein (DUF1015 family)
VAEVLPIPSLHYDLEKVALTEVVAPPYDVIDELRRTELVRRSPHNVVELDLPRDHSGGDPYEHAARLLDDWVLEGILTRDAEPAIWPLEQDYRAPDGRRPTRRGFLARVRLAPYGEGIRPHERTQPGPKDDRLRLTRATRHNLSPIFSLHTGNAWPVIEPAIGGDPWAEVTDGEGTSHRIWRIDDTAVQEAVAAELAPAQLLIADGHHRYETALAYQRELGGAGEHDHVLMALVSLEDPGLTVFATHRLLTDLDEKQRDGIRELAVDRFDLDEVEADAIVPDPGDPPGSFGYMDAHHQRAWRLRPKDEAAVDDLLPDGSDVYRRLDAAILEAVFLREAIGLSEEDIAAKRGLAYTPDAHEALRRLRAGECEAAFFLRPTPIDQVRAVAAAGETMPPKSTYFFPKLLTGIVFNPLA